MSKNDRLDPDDPETDAILSTLARNIVTKHVPQGTPGHGGWVLSGRFLHTYRK